MSYSRAGWVGRACRWVMTLAAGFGVLPVAGAQEASLIAKNAQTVILRDTADQAAGAFTPDIVLVEYFDYNCPYCKKLAPALETVLGREPKIGVVYKEWPILGDVSRFAAKSALAAVWQGRYLVAHNALINGPRLKTTDDVDELLRRAGLDIAQLGRDRETHAAQIDAVLVRNDTEAQALGMQGTPGLLVGRQSAPGNADAPALRRLIAEARKNP